MAMELKWMQCEVAKGMFPTERLVVVKDTDGSVYGEIFVDEEYVQSNDKIKDKETIEGHVRVYAEAEQGEKGLVTVLLPTATINNGRYMQVPKGWLKD